MYTLLRKRNKGKKELSRNKWYPWIAAKPRKGEFAFEQILEDKATTSSKYKTHALTIKHSHFRRIVEGFETSRTTVPWEEIEQFLKMNKLFLFGL